MHRYQNTLLKWIILGSDLGQWQLHIIYNFLADLHKSEVIFIDLYHQWSKRLTIFLFLKMGVGLFNAPIWMLIDFNNQRLLGACNRSPGSKLLSIITQLHCGGHLGGRARLPDTILEKNHPMTIPSKFGSNWATGSRQDGFYVNFP